MICIKNCNIYGAIYKSRCTNHSNVIKVKHSINFNYTLIIIKKLDSFIVLQEASV